MSLISCLLHRLGLYAKPTFTTTNGSLTRSTRTEWTEIGSTPRVDLPTYMSNVYVKQSQGRGNHAVTNWLQTLLYLIRRSYGYIYHLMISSEPVSEALLPIYNQLQTLKRCLIEVQNNGGVSTVRELYPYSMKVCDVPESPRFLC